VGEYMELGANLGDLDGIDAPNFKKKWGWGSCKLPKMSFFLGGGGGVDALVGIGT